MSTLKPSLYKKSLFLLAALASVIAASCSDSGVINPVSTSTEFRTTLKPIDENVLGFYELWASVETGLDHDESAYRSLGKFTVDATGKLNNISGGTFAVDLSKISNVNDIGDVIVTIQPPGYFDTIPSNIKVIGGAKSLQGNSLIFDLRMSYSDILPLSTIFGSSLARYILASPTSDYASAEFERGLWFSRDTVGNLAGISLPFLNDTLEWIYQGWVYERSNPANIYNMGRFNNPDITDSYNQCQGPNTPWQKPGQDWLQPNCPGGGLPDITDLNSNLYNVMITLEPRYEQGPALGVPFYIKLFTDSINTAPFSTVFTMQNVSGSNLPTGILILSSN